MEVRRRHALDPSGAPARTDAASSDDGGDPVVTAGDDGPSIAALVLVATVATAFVAQGGFYRTGQLVIAVGVAVAGALVARRPAVSVGGLGQAAAVSAAALAAWAVVRGAAAGSLAAGVSRAALVAVIVIAVAVCRRGDEHDRRALELMVLAVGVGVAVTGWVGVAAHVRPWAVTGASTWRAASTLTYPNSAAAVLVAVTLVAVARRTIQPGSMGLSVAATLSIAGAVATQSRAGAVGLVVGAVVLLAVLGGRAVWAASSAPVLGAGIVVAALLPGLDGGGPARPVIAAAGLLVGMAIAVGDAALAARDIPARRVAPVLASVMIGAIAVVALAGGAASALGDRISLASPERAGTNSAALDVIGDHLLVGVGPGRLTVAWSSPWGMLGTGLVHNEYLQTVAELGLVGGILLMSLLASAGAAALRGRDVVPRARWSGAVAALAALLVHSAFDFLWHIPAVVLLAAVLVGLATTGEAAPLSIPTHTTQTGDHHEHPS